MSASAFKRSGVLAVSILLFVACASIVGLRYAYADELIVSDANELTVQESTIATATEVQPTTSRSGVLTYDDKEHWYTFTVSTAGKYEVVFDGDYDTDEGYWFIELRDSNNELIYSGERAQDTLNPRTVVKTGLAPGKYYLRITCNNSAYDEGYSFDSVFTEASNWETELNNIVVKPSSISLDRKYYGTLSYRDIDFFKFTLASASTVAIQFGGEYSEYGYWYVRLRDYNIEEVASTSCSGKELNSKTVLKRDLKAGTYYIQIDGNRDASGLTYNFTVQQSKNIDSATVTGVASRVYTGSAVSQSPVVKLGSTTLKKDTDYTLSYLNNVKAGTATIVIKGKGSYSGTKRVNFKIVKASMQRTAVSVASQKYKNGKAVKPNPTVRYLGKTLKKGTDYKVSYQNNKKRGYASLTVRGIGNFKEKKTVRFRIY